jgi:hypothetical protein
MPPIEKTRNIVWKILVIGTLLLAFLIVPTTALDLSTDNPPSAAPTISQGDSVYVHGTATGHPQQGLNVWLLGNNYATVTNIAVGNDNTFEYEIKKAETQNLASGQYFVLIQHPMMNGEFDIVYNAATGQVTNRQLGGGTAIFQLTGAGSLHGPAAAAALVRAVGDQNVDDTFTTVTFFIEPPNTLIDLIPEHAVGDRFTITGTTNLAAGDQLMVGIISSSFKPTAKGQSGEFSGTGGTVLVQKGDGGLNRWSFDVDASTFRPDEYIVTVSAVLQDVKGSETFWIVEHTPTPTVTTPAVTATNSAAPIATTTSVARMTTMKSPVTVPIILTGALLALILFRNRDKL